MTDDKKVIVGRIGSSFGVKGWMKIQSFTMPQEKILDYHPWLIKLGKQWQEYVEFDHQYNGKHILIKLPECDSPEQAKQYATAKIAIYRSQMPTVAEDEYYWTDLEGCQVSNQQGVLLGVVDHLMSSGASDLLVIKGNKKQYLIPFLLNHFVLQVDLAAKKIVVDWDEDF